MTTTTLGKDIHFAMIPEWLLEADISATAIRLYLVLDRFADTAGEAFPSRRLLADRLNVKSVDTVDRALKELVEVSAITITRRYDAAGDPTSSRYLVHRTPPEGVAARITPPSRTDAATTPHQSGDGSRTDAALNQSHINQIPLTPPHEPSDTAERDDHNQPNPTAAKPTPATPTPTQRSSLPPHSPGQPKPTPPPPAVDDAPGWPTCDRHAGDPTPGTRCRSCGTNPRAVQARNDRKRRHTIRLNTQAKDAAATAARRKNAATPATQTAAVTAAREAIRQARKAPA